MPWMPRDPWGTRGCQHSPPRLEAAPPVPGDHISPQTTFRGEEPHLGAGSAPIPAPVAPDEAPPHQHPTWVGNGGAPRGSPPSVGKAQLLLWGEEVRWAMPSTRPGHPTGG